MSAKIQMNFSLNIENSLFFEEIQRFVDKNGNSFDYLEFLEEQKSRYFKENSVALNEFLLFFASLLQESEKTSEKTLQFLTKIVKERALFDFPR